MAPAVWMRCFARLIRWAIVASGTRKRAAISAVVSPPTARSVSADLRGRRQRRVAAQEQQRQGVVAVVRDLPDGSSAGGRARVAVRDGRHAGPPDGGGRRRCAARRSSRRDATVISHARGLSGDALRRPLPGGRQQRLLHGVLAGVEVAVPPDERAEDLRRQRGAAAPPARLVLGRPLLRRPIEASSPPRAGAGRTSTSADAGRTGRGRRSRGPARGSRSRRW